MQPGELGGGGGLERVSSPKKQGSSLFFKGKRGNWGTVGPGALVGRMKSGSG